MEVSPFSIRVTLFGSTWLWYSTLIIGLGLLSASIVNLRRETLQDESIRWLFFFASATLGACGVVVFVELLVPQIEVRFLEALMPMPPSWGLYQVWLWSVAMYFTFQSLWTWSDFALGPDDVKSKVAGKVEDIINVVALFTTVSLILVLLCKVMVSNLYSKKHSHKVVDALRQESTLAILAAIKPPKRSTEELPEELGDQPPAAAAAAVSAPPRTRRNSASDINTLPPQMNGDGAEKTKHGAKRLGTTTQGSMMLADGLTSSDPPKAPGLGLPRVRLTPASSANLAAIAELIEGNKLRQSAAAASRQASLVNAFSPPSSARAPRGQSPDMGAHRLSEAGFVDTRTGAVFLGGIPQLEGQHQLRRRTSQMRDAPAGSSPHGSIGRPSIDSMPLWTQSQQPGKTGLYPQKGVYRKSLESTPGVTRVEQDVILEGPGGLEGEDAAGPVTSEQAGPVTSKQAAKQEPPGEAVCHVSRWQSKSPGRGTADPGASVKGASVKGAVVGGSVEGKTNHAAVGDTSCESLTSMSTRFDSMLSVNPVPALTPVLTHVTPERVQTLSRASAAGRKDASGSDHDMVVMDIDAKGQEARGVVRSRRAPCLPRCFGALRACASCVFPLGLRRWLRGFWRELVEAKNAVLLLDVGTKQIRDILVKALHLQHRLRDPGTTHVLTSLELATALAERPTLRPSKSAPNLNTLASNGEGAARGPTQLPDTHKQFQLAEPRWLRLTSPRRLLDELLTIYSELKDGDLHSMATTYSELVFSNVCPSQPDYITRQDLHNRKIDDARLDEVWDECDKDGSGRVTKEELKNMAVSFYQQRRNLALTIHAMRNLTLSIQVAVVLLINCVFLMVVYLAMLDVTYLFGANKTSLDFFSAYIVVVSLMFGDLIKTVLGGAIFLLAQQPFDIGEDIIVEEAQDWRYKGVVINFNLMYITIKKSTDGELVTMPLSKITSTKFTNVTRSDWKIEQNYFAVDISTPRSVLKRLQEAALTHIMSYPQDFDTDYGFHCFFHGFEKPTKVIIRTFHRFRFNLAQPHRRSAAARDGVMEAIHRTFHEMNIRYTELRSQVPHGTAGDGYNNGYHRNDPVYPWEPPLGPALPQDALQRYYNAYQQVHVPSPVASGASPSAAPQWQPPTAPMPPTGAVQPVSAAPPAQTHAGAPSQQAGYTMAG